MKKVNLIPSNILIKNKIAYMFSQYVNLLYLYDFEEKETTLLSSIPGENFLTHSLCAKMFYYDDCILLIPLRAKKIWKYNLKTNEWSGFDLRPLVTDDAPKFFQAIQRGNKIIMIGCYYPSIVSFDLCTNELEYHTGLFDYFSSCESDDAYFRVDYVIQDRWVYLASCKTNVVARISFDDYEYEIFKVGKTGNTYSGITYDGNCFWLSPRLSTSIVKWDGGSIFEEYDISEKIVPCTTNFLGIFYSEGMIVLPGFCTQTLQVIKGKMCELDERYNFYQQGDESVASCLLSGVIRIESGVLCDTEFRCEVDVNMVAPFLFSDLQNSISSGTDIHIENPTIDLKVFLEYFV